MISALLTRRTWFPFECSSLLSSDYWRTTWIQMIQVEVLWRTLAPDIEFSSLPFTFLSLSMPVWLNNFDSKRLGTIDWWCCPIRCSRAGKKMSINLKKFEVSRGLGFAQSYYIPIFLYSEIKTPYLCSEVLEACSPWGRLYKETIQWCTNIIALTDRNTGQLAGGNNLVVDNACASRSDASLSNKNWGVTLSVISVFCSKKGTSDRKREVSCINQLVSPLAVKPRCYKAWSIRVTNLVD